MHRRTGHAGRWRRLGRLMAAHIKRANRRTVEAKGLGSQCVMVVLLVQVHIVNKAVQPHGGRVKSAQFI